MLNAERAAAGVDANNPASQAISIASLSHHDEVIKSLLLFDPFAITSPRAMVRVELDD